MAAITARILLDASKMTAQLEHLQSLFEKLPESRLEHGRGLLLGYMERMGLDLVFADRVTTTSASSILKIVQACWLGVEYENLVLALGAGNV